MKVWLLLGLLVVHEALEDVAGQHPPKNKRPKEQGENRIKPANKKAKPKVPKIKDRDSADSTPKSQSIMMQAMDNGRFQKPGAMMTLTAGQTVELRCKGGRVEWSYPAYLDTFKDSRLSVKQNERYGQLTLVNSTSADTGEFSCWGQLCSGYICRRDETRTGSTYIFFAEKGELFVPSTSYFDVVYLNPDRQAVVPCRVTVPSAKVTLHREFPAKEIPANGTDIVYDMKRGFVYLQPHSHHQGVVYCKAEAGGKSQISVKYQLLYVEVPSGPPSTTILASSNKVNGGDDISVLCTVLGEPDVEVEFRWIFPGQKDERPVTIQDTWRLIHRGLGHTTRISQSVITIEDFETIDAGYYICTAQNLRGQTTVATTVEFSLTWKVKYGQLMEKPSVDTMLRCFFKKYFVGGRYQRPTTACGSDRHPKQKEVIHLLIEVLTFLAESVLFSTMFLIFIPRKYVNNFV